MKRKIGLLALAATLFLSIAAYAFAQAAVLVVGRVVVQGAALPAQARPEVRPALVDEAQLLPRRRI